LRNGYTLYNRKKSFFQWTGAFSMIKTMGNREQYWWKGVASDGDECE
jgi:hypothetical protein